MNLGNGKYIVLASGLAIVVTAVVQGIYTAVTGVAMSSTVPGLLISVGLFGVVMFAVYAYYGKKLKVNADEMIALYDEACDPEAFVMAARGVTTSVSVPFDSVTSWYMSYFALAQLDLGEVQKAQRIEQDMYESIKQSDSVEEQAKIIVNLVPLVNRMLGPAGSIAVIEKGLELLDGSQAAGQAAQHRAYLETQLILARAAAAGDDEQLVRFYSAARSNAVLPLRVRVEQAWDEAKIHYKTGDVAAERACLEFIVENGNKLAMVAPARERLNALS